MLDLFNLLHHNFLFLTKMKLIEKEQDLQQIQLIKIENEHASRNRHCRSPNSLKIINKFNNNFFFVVRYYEKLDRNFENVLIQIISQHVIDIFLDSFVLLMLENFENLIKTIFAIF